MILNDIVADKKRRLPEHKSVCRRQKCEAWQSICRLRKGVFVRHLAGMEFLSSGRLKMHRLALEKLKVKLI